MATKRQKNATVKVVENRGNVSKSMRQVGYSKKTAKNPKNLTDSKGYKEEMKPFIDQLIAERQKAISAITISKRRLADYPELITGIDKMTKLIELLSGRNTDRFGFSIDKFINSENDIDKKIQKANKSSLDRNKG